MSDACLAWICPLIGSHHLKLKQNTAPRETVKKGEAPERQKKQRRRKEKS
jgi:hypothetical protein